MIEQIHVRNFAILEAVDLPLHPGFTVITGETGSGKSILVQAMAVALGMKPNRLMVRSGADRAVCEVQVDRHQFRRLVFPTGRTRSFIDDAPTPEPDYRKTTRPLADFHGQHEQQYIMDSRTHIDYLDQFAGHGAEVDRCRDLFIQLKACETRLSRARDRLTHLQETQELHTFQLREIDSVDPVAGEDQELQAELTRLAHAQELTELLLAVDRLLAGEDQSVLALLGEAKRYLDKGSRYDAALSRPRDLLAENGVALQEILQDIARLRDSIEADPLRLKEVEDRYQALESLKRKYGGSLEAVLETRARLQQDLSTAGAVDEEIEALEHQIVSLQQRYTDCALALSRKRQVAARRLCRELEDSLRDLDMAQAKIDVRLEHQPDPDSFCELDGDEIRAGEKGIDVVEFYLSANPGEELKPLAHIASGGEISRIMLALKSVFQGTDPVDTLIFDEIDTGISGQTALRVARALKNLAAEKQIVCITHLPQIAALADHHIHVEKETTGSSTHVHVGYVRNEERKRVLNTLLTVTEIEDQ